jgi:hypothetical protein
MSDIRESDIRELDTGDILLFRGNQLLSKLLECFGNSRYSHVGMVLKNPKSIHLDLEDGLYLLESSSNDTPDVEDHQFKIGVQIHRLDDVLREFSKNSIYVRYVNCKRDEAFYQRLSDVHNEVHNKPYDLNPADWIRAEWNLLHPLDIHPMYQKTNAFWCSALLCYIYGKLECLESEMDWSIIAPREFSSEEGTLLRFRCPVSKDTLYY